MFNFALAFHPHEKIWYSTFTSWYRNQHRDRASDDGKSRVASQVELEIVLLLRDEIIYVNESASGIITTSLGLEAPVSPYYSTLAENLSTWNRWDLKRRSRLSRFLFSFLYPQQRCKRPNATQVAKFIEYHLDPIENLKIAIIDFLRDGSVERSGDSLYQYNECLIKDDLMHTETDAS